MINMQGSWIEIAFWIRNFLNRFLDNFLEKGHDLRNNGLDFSGNLDNEFMIGIQDFAKYSLFTTAILQTANRKT